MPRSLPASFMSVVLFLAAAAHAATPPQAVVDELLAADRAFSASGAKTDVATALSAMFADDVTMPTPAGSFATGREAAIAALRANADNLTSHADWTPLRAGISADGRHGFTAGLMAVHRGDGTTMPLKYLAYWVKQAVGWRVAVYKRTRGTNTPGLSRDGVAAMRSVLPHEVAETSVDAGVVARHQAALAAAERAFSDDAQKMGLGPAFAKHGSADAINLGGPDDAGFIVGPEAIARNVAAGGPATGSAVSWSADRVIVAASGDLGVTIGMIRRNQPVAGQPDAFPFFTIWHREAPTAPWRYIAE